MFLTRIAADPSGAARMGLASSNSVRGFVYRLFGGGRSEEELFRGLLYADARTPFGALKLTVLSDRMPRSIALPGFSIQTREVPKSWYGQDAGAFMRGGGSAEPAAGWGEAGRRLLDRCAAWGFVMDGEPPDMAPAASEA